MQQLAVRPLVRKGVRRVATLAVATVGLGAALAWNGAAAPARAAAPVCEGASHLCDRRYDEVSYLTSHNAMSIKAEGWKAPNQYVSLDEQLSLGVRALMWDLHYDNSVPVAQRTNEVFLCHAFCVIGKRPLGDALSELKAWLDTHPTEVLSIIFETYVSPADVQSSFDAAGLSPMLVDHDPAVPWPTLGELIANGTRLVVMTDSGGGAFPGYLPVWDHAVETPFSAKVATDFTCSYNRGDPANALFIINHFLTDPGPRRDRATVINANPFLADRVEQCQDEQDRRVNYVTLDFVELGDGPAVVAALNAPPPPSTTTTSSTLSTASASTALATTSLESSAPSTLTTSTTLVSDAPWWPLDPAAPAARVAAPAPPATPATPLALRPAFTG